MELISKNLFLRPFYPDAAHRDQETSAELGAAPSAPDTARRETTPSPRESARPPGTFAWRKWSGGSKSCYGARGGLAGGVFALVNRAVGWWAVGAGVGSRAPGVGSRAVPRHGRAEGPDLRLSVLL